MVDEILHNKTKDVATWTSVRFLRRCFYCFIMWKVTSVIAWIRWTETRNMQVSCLTIICHEAKQNHVLLQYQLPFRNICHRQFDHITIRYGIKCCDGTTNQTNQQRQDLTANIFNAQLYTFITTFRKIQNSFKNRKNDDRNIKKILLVGE